jgi:hypothetical protein
MSRFDAYRDRFPNARLNRSKTGVLEVALHTGGGTVVFNGYTHEQFVCFTRSPPIPITASSS